MLGDEGKLPRTTKIFAKYDPTRLRAVTRALTKLWLDVSCQARKFGAEHMLTTGQRGDPIQVIKKGGDEAAAREFVKKLFANVKVLDSGARGSTTTFVQNGIGDVLISWENEAALILKESGADKFEIIAPKVSIQAEPPVTVVDKNAERHKTTEVARAYVEYLYSPEGQELAAKHHYRPRSKEVAAGYASSFPDIQLFTVDELFGGWQKAQKDHFSDGASFDQIYAHGDKP